MRSHIISKCLGIMDLDCRIREKNKGLEMRCYRRLLNISYNDHAINEEVRRKIQAAIGTGGYDELLTLGSRNENKDGLGMSKGLLVLHR